MQITGLRRISVVIPSYRDSERAITLVRGLQEQHLPVGWSLEIIVVDDGSGAPHDELLGALVDSTTTAIVLPVNVGRASAREAGIDRSNGELLMLTDSDCVPASLHFLAAHIRAMSDTNAVASAGPVLGYDQGFWSRYQNDAAERRVRRDSLTPGVAGTTANVCIRRQTYLEVSGLDRRYTGYGFEDRDLLLRLANKGCIAWTPDAQVKHMDDLSLSGICRKVAEAGQGNSALFAQRHPSAYRSLGYDRFDARRRPALALLGRVLDPIVPRIATSLDPHLERLPFPLSRFLVKALSAVAFLAGTSRAVKPVRRAIGG